MPRQTLAPRRSPTLLLVIALLTLALAGCGGDGVGPGSGQSPDPVVEDFAIAYVRRPVPLNNQGNPAQDNLGRPAEFNAGGDLYLRPRAAISAPERNLTAALTTGAGDVRDLAVSYDGERLLFALRLPEIEGADEDEQPTWNIWEYDRITERLRRVISSDILAEDGQDLSPNYLPDGRILFSSTRQQRAGAMLLDEAKPRFAALEESRREPALVLHVMNADGTDIRQISFNQSHDLDPAVLDDGRVVFSRWEQMSGRNAIHLYTLEPDGRDLQLLYGRNSHASGTEGDTIQFVQPRVLSDGRILSLIRPFSGSDFGGDLVVIDAAGHVDREMTVDGLAGSTQEKLSSLPVRTARGLSPGGRFASAYPLNDGSDRLLVSWSPCLIEQPGGPAPCTEAALADPDADAARPLYGLWIHDPSEQTQKPVVPAAADQMITEAVALNPRRRPALRGAGVNCDPLIPDCEAERVGLIDIRSVYDIDGVDSSDAGIAVLADPLQTPASQRPARYLRIIKAVGIPDDDVRDFDDSAYGVTRNQLMREILGYAEVAPDGSVLAAVPADVAFTIEVVDAQGRRISTRHRNWLQLRPGERLSCNGCHAPTGTTPHGRAEAQPPSANPGATLGSLPFPNTHPDLFAEAGETMAQTRARISCFTDCSALRPSVDLRFVDVWTDPALRPVDDRETRLYADLLTPAPVSAECQADWDASCRVLIHYPEHIQPLWERSRPILDVDGLTVLGDRRCLDCHRSTDDAGNPRVPDGQLDLGAGASDREADHFTSYQELLAPDDVVELDENGRLLDRLVQATDAAGNPLFQTDNQGNPLFELDANGEPLLDASGQPIPLPLLVRVRAPGPSMSANGAAASAFFQVFGAGGSHAGDLSVAELRLLAEWLDIGAQYFNNPFSAPEN